jgi:hypothetical protein
VFVFLAATLEMLSIVTNLLVDHKPGDGRVIRGTTVLI